MSESLTPLIVWLIPLAPLLSAGLIALLGPKVFGERSHIPCCLALLISFLCSLVLLNVLVPHGFATDGSAPVIALGYDWITIGGMDVRIDLRADAMTAIMLTMVTGVSTLVALFGSGYMHGDPGYPRFFAAVSGFVFSMTMLVLAGNFLMMFAFWEAVGLCSYLLIGFWFQKPSAAAAAKKAFVVNRIGDFGFLIGIFLIWTTFGSLNFSDVLANPALISEVAAQYPGRITWICLLLFLGAMGKSAQFPLHVWLPDAMEGPTPVSALIHAATMVTAGVYMVARCTPLFMLAPTAQLTVAAIGAATALIAAITALTQTDLKRVLAYSTVSQLGFMFMALGAAAGYDDGTSAVTAGMFHLFTHAFFKALLFLAAGSVMHSMGNVIDMRLFGGLRRVLPITHWTFLAGSAALAGIPLLSGFWSKDEILAVLSHATHHEQYASFFKLISATATLTAVLTAFYTFRAYFMTFWGKEYFPEEAGHHPHDAPPSMAWPLRILAVFALLIGGILGPTGLFGKYLHHTLGLTHTHHELHFSIMITSGLLAMFGVFVAWLFYVKAPAIPAKIEAGVKPLYLLSLNKLYFDEIFYALIVAPLRGLAKFATIFDLQLIDRIVNSVGAIPRVVSVVPRRMHNGLVSCYSMVMWIGLVVGVLFALGCLS